MCRSIKKLRVPERAPTDEELRAAALQFVRKISGQQKPTQACQAAFDQAVADIAGVAREMFDAMGPSRPSRVTEAAR